MGEKIAQVNLFRHGETTFHGTKRVAGGMTDVPLNGEGIRQAAALATRTKTMGFTEVHTSPLSRAFYTARPLAVAHGVEPIRVAALRERRFGRAIEELTDEDRLAEVREDLVAFWKLPPMERMDVRLVPDMETDRQLLRRVRGYLGEQPPGSNIGAATHWDVISTLIVHEKGQLIDPANATGATLHVVGGEIEVVDLHGNVPILEHAA